MEFGWRLKPPQSIGSRESGPGFYPTVVGAEFLWSFIRLVQLLYARFSPAQPLVFYYSLFNVKDLLLTPRLSLWQQEPKRWQEDELHLRSYPVDDLATEARTLPGRISEDLWQAFGLRQQNVFKETGAINY